MDYCLLAILTLYSFLAIFITRPLVTILLIIITGLAGIAHSIVSINHSEPSEPKQ